MRIRWDDNETNITYTTINLRTLPFDFFGAHSLTNLICYFIVSIRLIIMASH